MPHICHLSPRLALSLQTTHELAQRSSLELPWSFNKLPSLLLLSQHLKVIYSKDLLTLKKIKIPKPSTLSPRNSHDLALPLGIW